MSGDGIDDALELIREFVQNKISAATFTVSYMKKWKQLRDSGGLDAANPYVRRALSVVFQAADSVEDPVGGRSLETHAGELYIQVATVLSVVDGVK